MVLTDWSLKCLWTGALVGIGSRVESRRILLVKMMIGLLISKKSLESLTTPNGKRNRMYAILFMIVIVITTVCADTCIRLYAASISSLEMSMHAKG